ncbi:MAG: DUF805 domain-containing protein [Candidatus Nomurabacteria bacterium]|nr:DUF805 domain-containing protein [Candidatus Nomurabacteria bacterium]
MNYYFSVLKKYAVFNGRARRAEYWYFVLFNAIVSIILGILGKAIGVFNVTIGTVGSEMNILSIIYGLAVFLPGLAVCVRRLHDTGKSGWMVLINLIPLIGQIWILVLIIKDSTPGENEYGSNPKNL